jgi:hypothetical protein
MTTKQIVLSTLIFGAINNIALGMENNNVEEATFQENVGKLKQPIADFVMDFKTWPKEERDKIKLFSNGYVRGYQVSGNITTPPGKYGKNLGFWLDCNLHRDQEQLTPFFDAIDYLKQQQ